MLRILIVISLLMLAALPARAALCTVDVEGLDFGQVDTLGGTSALTSAGITIECEGVTPGETKVTLCGSFGAGSGGAAGGFRRAVSGGDTLGFVLSATDGGGIPWGSLATPELGAPRSIQLPVDNDTLTASGNLTLYGVVPTGQSTAPVGLYSADVSGADALFAYAEGELDCNAPAGASETSAAFAVTADVSANCRLDTADLDFGTTGRIGSNIDGETSLAIVCTAGTGYGIAIDGGGSGDPTNRLLVSGDKSIRYGLYSNAQRSTIWGMEENSMVTGDGDGTVHPYWVYGRIPPQPAAAGAYADTVVVTLFYD